MARSILPPAPAIDMNAFVGIAAGPAAVTVLAAGLVQSIGHWSGADPVGTMGGPVPLLLGTAVLIYAVFALVHLLHAVGDHLTGQPTPLWWCPGSDAWEAQRDEGAADMALAAASVPIFPAHIDGAVLSGGLSLAAWLSLTGVI
jgi:hypothetical protein